VRREQQPPQAERRAATTAAAPDRPTGPPSATAGKQPPVPWLSFAIQVFVMIRIAVGLKSALVFMLGAFWLGYSLMSRKLGWPRFLLAMLAIGLLGAFLRI